jgi:hypothetical protein
LKRITVIITATVDFNGQTPIWKAIMFKLKRHVIYLINNGEQTPFDQLSKESVMVLEKLNSEICKSSIFDKIDSEYNSLYQAYNQIGNHNMHVNKSY